MAAATLGSLVLELGADIAKLRRDVGQATGVLQGFARTAQGIGNQIKGVFAGLGAGALVAAARNAAAFADNLIETADAVGLNAQRFQELQFAAQQSGVSAEQFATGLGRLAKQAGEAGIGTERAFDLVLERMRQASTQSERVAVAMEAFGRSGRQMALAFGDGGAAAEEMAAKLRQMGGVLSEEVLRKVGEANDKIDAFAGVLRANVVQAIGAYAIPALEGLIDKLGVLSARSVTVADEVSTSVSRIGNRLQQWWQQLKLAIPDFMGKDQAQADLEALRLADQALQRRQASIQAVAGAIGQAEQSTIRATRAVKDLTLTPDESAFFSGLGKPAGETAKRGGGGRSGPSAYDEGLRITNDLIEEESRRLEQLSQRWYEVLSPVEQVNVQWAKLDEELARGEIGWELYARATLKASEALDDATRQAKAIGEGFDDLGRTIASSIATGLATATTKLKSFGDAVKSILGDVGRAVASTLLSKFVVAPISAGIESGLGSLFGTAPGKAAGGTVLSGRAYVVGERGPELFVPGVTGAIAPNAGAAGATTVNVNIQAVDARSVASLLTENQGLIAGLVTGSYRKQGLSVRR